MPVLTKYGCHLPLSTNAELIFKLWESEARANGFEPAGIPEVDIVSHRVFSFQVLRVVGDVISYGDDE